VTDCAGMIELRGVRKIFEKKRDAVGRVADRLGLSRPPPVVRAVDGVDLRIVKGEVVGLVGESGCGKSTLARIVAGISSPTDGAVFWRGQDRAALTGRASRQAKLDVQMVFQDPFSSLNPRQRVAEIVGGAAYVHGLVTRKNLEAYVDAQLSRAGLPAAYRTRYPHQFSGGQRQRIGIARALAVQPKLLVCDEAVSALDVSIQAQIINLFMKLRRELDLTYLFISHDLGVVEHIADRVVIMYLGRVVEEAPAADLFAAPLHPYTQALLAQVPRIGGERKTFVAMKGEMPSPLKPPTGCHFHPRCPHVMPRCRREAPTLMVIGAQRRSACHLHDVAQASGQWTGAEPMAPAAGAVALEHGV